MTTTIITLNGRRVTVPKKEDCLLCDGFSEQYKKTTDTYWWVCSPFGTEVDTTCSVTTLPITTVCRPHDECIRARKEAENG